MPTTTKRAGHFIKVMNAAHFYNRGVPGSNVKERDPSTIQFKYRNIFDSEKLGATAVYEIAGSPCIYFKSFGTEPTADQIREWKRMAWNDGRAQMLWVITPAKVEIYNSYSRPTPTGKSEENRLETFKLMETGLRDLNEQAGRLMLESGRFWDGMGRAIDREKRVDKVLLRNLRAVEEELTADLPSDVAHAFLGRSIFVAYLCDRKILRDCDIRNILCRSDKRACYTIFEQVKDALNGDLFPLEHEGQKEHKMVRASHLKLVGRLLRGEEIRTSQTNLFPYQFDVIPIELISSIYEMFVHSKKKDESEENDEKRPNKKKDDDVYYTPVNLVDLVLDEVFGPNVPLDAKVLDPACGSGVFLVESLRRLVERHIGRGREHTRELVRHTLYNQIYGMDIKPEAVRITAFSLYLAAIELDPDPTEQPLSKQKFKPLLGKNLFCGEALMADDAIFLKKPFQIIVGNPPWSREDDSGPAVRYSRETDGHPISNNNPAEAFLWRAHELSEDGRGTIGLVMPSLSFLGQTPDDCAIRKAFLSALVPKVMCNLSALRGWLFNKASAPAMVYVAEKRSPRQGDSFTFVSLPKSPMGRKHATIEIGTENVKRLTVAQAVSDRYLLKVASWGRPRDMALITRLAKFPALVKLVEGVGGKSGKGCEIGSGGKPDPWLAEQLYLPGKPSTIQRRFLLDYTVLKTVPARSFRRAPDDAIFKAPLVIVAESIKQKRLSASFSSKDIAYCRSYFGFSVTGNRDLAHYLNAILNSSIATYYCFLTAARFGVERDRVELEAIERLPVPPMEESSDAMEKVLSVERKLLDLVRAGRNPDEAHQKELDESVYKIYGLSKTEQILVEDMLDLTMDHFMTPSKSAASWPMEPSEVEQYAHSVISVIQPFLNTLGERRIVANIKRTPSSPMRVVEFRIVSSRGSQGQKSVTTDSANRELASILTSIEQHLQRRDAGQLYSSRIVRAYCGESVYFLKPDEKRYWSRSEGLQDADAILSVTMKGDNVG